MPRIRTTKPEFWEDEKIGALSPQARLLFIGTWNLADDEGLLRWTPDYINAALFMYDGLSIKRVTALMDELVSAELVVPYMAAKTNQRLGWILHFRRHQKINRPQPGKFPAPSLQNPVMRDWYGVRDRWVCHLCKGPIQHDVTIPNYEPDLQISLDHFVPKIDGGSDYPSNIYAAHIGCNKSRGRRPISEFEVPRSVAAALAKSGHEATSDSVSHSVNDAVSEQGSFTPGTGSKEQGSGTGIEEADQGLPPTAGSGAVALVVAPDVGAIVGWWIDSCAERPPNSVIARIGKTVRELVGEGIAEVHIRKGISDWQARGLDPSTLPGCVNAAMNAKPLQSRGQAQNSLPWDEALHREITPREAYP